MRIWLVCLLGAPAVPWHKATVPQDQNSGRTDATTCDCQEDKGGTFADEKRPLCGLGNIHFSCAWLSPDPGGCFAHMMATAAASQYLQKTMCHNSAPAPLTMRVNVDLITASSVDNVLHCSAALPYALLICSSSRDRCCSCSSFFCL